MLSRTADNLYWLSRYVERAENLARILDVALRLSNLPSAYAGTSNEWESAVATAACADAFAARYGEEATPENVVEFLALSSENPFSIRSCIEVARQNARAVRTALTVEMWEAINTAWLELNRLDMASLKGPELARFLAWVKDFSLRFDGFGYRTMLRSEAYFFSRLGIYVERADNTARILDVKYHVLLPQPEPVGGGLDYFQWAAVLRSVSALTSYQWVYRQNVKPWLVADFLILRPEMPRSLATCYDNIVGVLDQLAQHYGRQGPSQRLARTILSDLRNSDIDTIFRAGLHEFISRFIDDNNRLGRTVAEQYLR
jgi:uncharacterized alpha-E superfamily protein